MLVANAAAELHACFRKWNLSGPHNCNKTEIKQVGGSGLCYWASLSLDALMTSNDFAANLYDIEVTFVTEAYGIGSIVM